MQKLATVFSNLSPMRRLMVIAATAGVFAAVLFLARMGGSSSMTLLYSGLEPAAAGEVIQSLDQMGVTYEVRGAAIYVDAARRDSLRMALAAEGKPAGGGSGYEILDGLSGFGTTSQMFDAAYWRAKEGELARTILVSPQIRSARVHISNLPSRSFGNGAPTAASVVVSTGGSALSAPQAKALRFLVASAVAGLDPDSVSIIDSERGLVSSGDDDLSPTGDDRAEVLRRNVQRLIEARVGYGNAVVEVNVDTVTEREEITERTFDPDTRVAISTVTEETSATAKDTRDGAVTVSGNLPDGNAGGRGADSSSQDSQTRETVNYEVSQTQRAVVRLPGSVKRISVAVLVNGVSTQAQDGSTTWEPRSEEEMASLRELVSSAVGLDEARGDTITLRSMEFPAIAEVGTAAPEPVGIEAIGLDMMQLIQIGVLAVTALILGLFVVRPILSGATPAALPRPAPGLPAPRDETPSLPSLSGEIDGFMPQMAVVDNIAGFSSLPGGASAEEPSERLRKLIAGRQTDAAAILQGWLEKA